MLMFKRTIPNAVCVEATTERFGRHATRIEYESKTQALRRATVYAVVFAECRLFLWVSHSIPKPSLWTPQSTSFQVLKRSRHRQVRNMLHIQRRRRQRAQEEVKPGLIEPAFAPLSRQHFRFLASRRLRLAASAENAQEKLEHPAGEHVDGLELLEAVQVRADALGEVRVVLSVRFHVV